jgi:hypothetical protein
MPSPWCKIIARFSFSPYTQWPRCQEGHDLVHYYYYYLNKWKSPLQRKTPYKRAEGLGEDKPRIQPNLESLPRNISTKRWSITPSNLLAITQINNMMRTVDHIKRF